MKKRNITALLPGSPAVVQAPVDVASLHGADRMWCIKRDMVVLDMIGQKAAHIPRKATTAVTFTDDVGGLAVDEVKTRRNYYI